MYPYWTRNGYVEVPPNPEDEIIPDVYEYVLPPALCDSFCARSRTTPPPTITFRGRYHMSGVVPLPQPESALPQGKHLVHFEASSCVPSNSSRKTRRQAPL